MNRRFMKSMLAATAVFLLCVYALPARAIRSDPSVIAFDDGTGNHAIYAFARGDQGTLVVNYWWNWNWAWADLGLPAGARYINVPSAVTYQGPSGIQYIDVFVQTESGHLAVDHWDGGQWNWDDLSAEVGAVFGFTPIATEPNAITYVDESGDRQLKVFSIDEHGNLWVSSCDGLCETIQGTWQGLWSFYLLSDGSHHTDWPKAVHFIDRNGHGRTYVFAVRDSSDFGFDAYYTNDRAGYNYIWADLGLPSHTHWTSAPLAVIQDFPGFPAPCPTLHVLATSGAGGVTGRLFDRLGCSDLYFYFGLGGWSHWADEGAPGPLLQPLEPTMDGVSYVDPVDGQSRLHVFVQGPQSQLVHALWNHSDTGPLWSDHGLPARATAIGKPGVVAFVEWGEQRVYAFSTTDTGHLVVNFCQGSSACDSTDPSAWRWADQSCNSSRCTGL